MSTVISIEWGDIATLIDKMIDQKMPFIVLNGLKYEKSRSLYQDITGATSQLIIRMRDKDAAFLRVMNNHRCRIYYDYDFEAAWTSKSRDRLGGV